MYSASDLKKGLKVEIDGQPYVITEFNFVKPGKGQAIYTCKMKNLISGSTLMRQYRDNARIDKPHLEEKSLQYSYLEGDNLVFLDANYEQVIIPAAVMGDSKFFLVPECTVDVLYFNDRPIEVTLPTFVEKEIVHTEPGVRGDTATNVTKVGSIEGGYELQIPLFVDQGDVIRIDTRTGKYVDRVRK
jgi:elongation factor P